MLDDLIRVVRDEFSGTVAKRYVEGISRFHRIQASPGFREAARFVADRLSEGGLPARILEFPAKQGVRFWSEKSFMEWDIEEAELVLYPRARKPERLCSFRENPVSVIQRSGSTPPDGVRCQLVPVERGDDPASYQGIDVKGKVVLSSGDASKIRRLAVEERGALGVIVDNMTEFPPVRARMDVPDAVQYVSFWPEAVDDPLRFGFGFVVSPRQGERLRELLKNTQSPAEVFARVKTRFYEGAIEVVEAFIPGQTPEEVVGTAHLCHPFPGANDNASGAGALLEVALTLHRLFSSGKLPAPLRGIRFLWVPEMTGTYAYLASDESRTGRVKAGINLDMVGEDQESCGSVLTVEKPPRATPSFSGDVAWSVLKKLTAEAQNLAGTASYPLFRWTVAPFSGGSDHYIWSDPSVGVGCPMLIQWPDKFYHTSEDTPDKVDPRMLRIVGVAAATYLYFLASAGPREAAFLAGEMAAHYHHEANELVEETLRGCFEVESSSAVRRAPEEIRRVLALRLAFIESRKILDVESLRLLGTSAVLDRRIEEAIREIRVTTGELWKRALSTLALVGEESSCPRDGRYREEPPELEELLNTPAEGEPSSLVAEARTVVPCRVFRGPVSVRSSAGMPEDLRKEWESFSERWKEQRRLLPYVGYWADGRRSVLQVSSLIEAETGRRETQLVLEYVRVMTKLGYFQYR